LHEGFKHIGLRLAKVTENMSHDGYDKIVQDKAYHFKITYRYALEDEIIAFKIR
jgi:hypothetical protein